MRRKRYEKRKKKLHPRRMNRSIQIQTGMAASSSAVSLPFGALAAAAAATVSGADDAADDFFDDDDDDDDDNDDDKAAACG